MASAFPPAEILGTQQTPGGTITLRRLTRAGDLDLLVVGEGLGAYGRYRPGETHAILHRVLKAPEGRVTAALAGNRLVGHLSLFQPDPGERWGQRPIPGLLKLGTLEVDRGFRRQGLTRPLLDATVTGGSLDKSIVLAPQYASDWDLETSGRRPREYRHLILRLFRRHGFAEFVTETDRLVGIITDTDILGVLVDVMGIREPSTRIELTLPDRPGALAEVTRIIKAYEVNISSIVTMTHWEAGKRLAIIRLKTMNPQTILKDLAAAGFEQPPPQ